MQKNAVVLHFFGFIGEVRLYIVNLSVVDSNFAHKSQNILCLFVVLFAVVIIVTS